MPPVEMEKFVKNKENEEEIHNRRLQQNILDLELELLQIYSNQGLPNLMQQDPKIEKLHLKIDGMENLIEKQEHNMNLLLHENKKLKKQVADLIYADNCRRLAGSAGCIGLPLYPAERHEQPLHVAADVAQPQLRFHEADREIPAGAGKVVSALAEEVYFIQLEENADFISAMLETIDILQLKYSTLPVITVLDMMDKSCPELDKGNQSSHQLDMMDQLFKEVDARDQSTPITQDTNNNLMVHSHLTPHPECPPGPPAMKHRGSWWPAGNISFNPFKPEAKLNIGQLNTSKLDITTLDISTDWVKPDTFMASIKPVTRDQPLTTSPPPSTSTTVGPSSQGRRPRPGGGRIGRADRKPGRARVRQFQP